MLDLTTIATLLGVPASGPVHEHAAVSESGLKPPPWWPGDEVAAESSIQAARQFGFVVGRLG